MEQNLRDILSSTINPDNTIRNEAEDQLKNVGKSPECMYIIQNVLIKDTNVLMKQISSLFFVNALKKNWKEPEMQGFIKTIEGNILDNLAATTDSDQIPYLKILQLIFDNKEDESLNQIFEKLPFFINDASREKKMAALLFIDGIFKNDNMRYDLSDVLSSVFDRNVQAFSRIFTDALQSSDFAIAKICMKIIARAYSYYSLPDSLTQIDVFSNYVYTAFEIMKIPFSHDESTSKLKKWATFFLYKCTSKGFKKYFMNPEFSTFMKRDEIVSALIDKFFSIITDFQAMKVIGPRILTYTCDFFVLLAENKATKPLIHNNYAVLLTNFILPVQSYDNQMKELFEYDEEKYLNLRYNYISSDLRSGTSSLFSTILRSDKKIKTDVLNSLLAFLKNRDAPNYLPYRYGVIGLLAGEQRALQKVIGKAEYENFIISEIFTDLRSSEEFLISQALYFLSLGEDNTVSADSSLEAFKYIFKIVSEKSEGALPVEAALSFNFFIQNSGLFEALKPVVSKIFMFIITFSKKYILESLSNIMDVLIESYPDEIAVIAPQLAESICENILNIIETDDENKLSTVSSFMNTIDRLVLNADSQRATIDKIYACSYKVIYTIFAKRLENFYQEALDLTNTFLFSIQNVNESMMVIFNNALSIPPEDISFYPRELMDFIDNFLSYGKASIVNPQTLELIYNVIDIFIPSKITDEFEIYDEDYEAGCRISDSLMLNAGHAVHSMNPNIIPCLINKMVVNYKGCADNDYLYVLSLEVIMNCFIIASAAVLSTMGAFTNVFFSEIQDKYMKFKRVHDKKVFILFVGALFTYSSSELGLNWGGINEAFVNTLYSLPEAIKKRNKLKDRENEEEREDEGYESEYNDVYESDEEYDAFEEDIWFETDLDKFNVYGYVRELLTSPKAGSLGSVAISKMTPQQVSKINEILSVEQEQQK